MPSLRLMIPQILRIDVASYIERHSPPSFVRPPRLAVSTAGRSFSGAHKRGGTLQAPKLLIQGLNHGLNQLPDPLRSAYGPRRLCKCVRL